MGGNGNYINGNHDLIIGNGNGVAGNENNVYGDGNLVFGDDNNVVTVEYQAEILKRQQAEKKRLEQLRQAGKSNYKNV